MTTIEAFFDQARRHPRRLAWKHRGRGWSREEAAGEVRRMARALISLGVKPGQAVAIVGPNRPEWVIADLGAIAAAAVPVPIYPTLSAEQSRYIANHCEAMVAVVSDTEQREKLRGSKVREFVLMDQLDSFLERGDSDDVRLPVLRSDALATLIYTSGTTGPPKAVMLTHANLLFAAQTAQRIGKVTHHDVVVSYLPLSHVAEQMIAVHGPAVNGAQVYLCDVLEKTPEVLKEARPTIFFGVPRVWEKMQSRIEETVARAPNVRQSLFAWARRSRSPFADRLVLRKVRAALGLHRVRLAVTGAAAMPRATLDFFDSIGIPILDMWGMTESTAFGTANLPGARKPGTIGRPVQGAEIRIAADGEILTRGPHVFAGYYKDPAATREAIDAEGFLHTGDVGAIDEDGYVRITDRKKDLLITSGGKNVSPQNIESRLGRIAGVSQAVVVGDARKYLAALIVPEAIEKAADPAFIDHVGREIDKLNRELAHYETIKKFKVLPAQFSVATGELTPTMKLKRRVVNERYRAVIDELFQ